MAKNNNQQTCVVQEARSKWDMRGTCFANVGVVPNITLLIICGKTPLTTYSPHKNEKGMNGHLCLTVETSIKEQSSGI